MDQTLSFVNLEHSIVRNRRILLLADEKFVEMSNTVKSQTFVIYFILGVHWLTKSYLDSV